MSGQFRAGVGSQGSAVSEETAIVEVPQVVKKQPGPLAPQVTPDLIGNVDDFRFSFLKAARDSRLILAVDELTLEFYQNQFRDLSTAIGDLLGETNMLFAEKKITRLAADFTDEELRRLESHPVALDKHVIVFRTSTTESETAFITVKICRLDRDEILLTRYWGERELAKMELIVEMADCRFSGNAD